MTLKKQFRTLVIERMLRGLLVVAVLTFLEMRSVRAQWQSQSFVLKPGWNAIFLHVDASHVLLDNLIIGTANPIAEIWLWQPPMSTLQFITTPQEPSVPNSQWAVWDRSPTVDDTLVQLIGNRAYLVRNNSNSDFLWAIKGRPVPPSYQWTTTGLNFIGFPTPANAPPNFETFLLPSLDLLLNAEVYRYAGGDLGASNPARVLAPLFRNTAVTRGEAFWMRSGNIYNRYFGPVDVQLQNSSGIDFADHLGVYNIRLKNQTTSARTITLSLLPSETPPSAQPAITAPPPLLLRGALNTTNLTYNHTVLDGPKSFTLAAQGQPGSELELVIGLNRSAMTAISGSLYAGILRFTDEAGLSQIDAPVAATVADAAGLWVGNASVTQVGQYLKTYQTDRNGNPVLGPISSNGAAYVATGTNTALTSVARSYPLRLILHNNSASNIVNLLQRVFVGLDQATNIVASTRESLLNPAKIGSARRISAAHLPFSEANTGWPNLNGSLQAGSTLTFNVNLDYNDQASNPFLHTFHPDHDNLKADFKTVEPRGVESYGVTRRITLTFNSPANDFNSLTSGAAALAGNYAEVITFGGLGSQSRQFTLAGVFSLNRISAVPTLSQ